MRSLRREERTSESLYPVIHFRISGGVFNIVGHRAAGGVGLWRLFCNRHTRDDGGYLFCDQRISS